MKKIYQKPPGKLPQFNSAKLVRLAIFAVLTVVGFTFSHYGHMSTFGWGYFFGLICMAVLVGNI
ncbi:MAG: hypothetical protein PHW62_04670 [Candidatus Ratteibacteria bacterium]|nr:hypothetical protein [Candidatus Ratteibacteria bacterium]